MTSEKKDKNGITTLLVILSALTILSIIIAAGFWFFYPGLGAEEPTPLLASGDSPFEKGTPSITAPDETIPLADSSAMENRDALTEDSSKEDSVPPLLDDSEALIDSLMNSDSSDASGRLDILFEEPEKEEENSSAEPVKTSVSAPVEKKPEPRYITVDKTVYWIQVASYPNSIKADELKAALNAKGIHSTIQTRNINDTLYYRVRIGAFTSKSEADNFNAMLLELKEVDETQIYTTTVSETQRVD